MNFLVTGLCAVQNLESACVEVVCMTYVMIYIHVFPRIHTYALCISFRYAR